MDFGMFVLCAFIATTKMVLTANHADYNQTCERTSDCYADLVAYNFECVGHDTYTATSCNTGRCLCPNTRYLQPLAFTLSCDLKKRELDDCNNHLYECGAGLVCRHNEYGLTKCLPFKRLGEPCSANEDCAYDSDGRADSRMCQGTCQCNSGLITEGDKCRRPRVGDPCSDLNLASTCISTMLGDPSVEIETCQDGTCACPSTAEEVTVLMDGQENVFCVTKYDGTKKGDGEPCSAHNMCSSNFCVNCPGSSNVCVRQRDETAEPRPDIDECLSVSCLNGGTCINLQGGFMCECPPGFRGDTCGIGTTTRPTDSDGDVTSVRTDLVNGANQTTPIWVLIAILWIFLILD